MSVSRVEFVRTLDTLLSKGDSAAIQGAESELRELYDLLDPHARGNIDIDDIDRLIQRTPKIWKEEPSIPSCGPIPRLRQWMLKEQWLFVDLLKKIGEAPLSKSEFEQTITIPASFLPTSVVDELFKLMAFGQTKRLCPKELCERLVDSASFKETLRKRAVRHVVRKVLSDPARDLVASFRHMDPDGSGYLSVEQQYAVLKSLDCPDLSFIDKRLVIDTESYETVAQMLINEARNVVLLQLQRGCERLLAQLDKFESRLKQVGPVVTVDQARMCLPQDLRANDFFDLLVKATVGGGAPFKITEWVDNGVSKWPAPEVMLSRIFGGGKPARKKAPLEHQLTLLFYKIHQTQRKNNLTARQMFDCLASSGKSLQVEELRNAVYSLLNLSSVPTSEELGLPKKGDCLSFEEFCDKISFELAPFQKSLEVAFASFPGASMPMAEFTKFFVPTFVTKVQYDNLLRLVFGPNALALKEVQRQPLELFLGTVQTTKPDTVLEAQEKLAKVELPGPNILNPEKITPLADAGRRLAATLAEANDRGDPRLQSLRALCRPEGVVATGCLPMSVAKQVLEPVLSPELWSFVASKAEWNIDNGVDHFDVQAFLADLHLPPLKPPQTPPQTPAATLRVNIAQAVHLRKINGESPSTFVALQWGTTVVGRTQVIYKTTCPAWRHDCDITLPQPTEAYPDGYKDLELVLRVMHSAQAPIELGWTTLALAPLCYLPEIDGYYNIEGSTLEDHGQIRLTIRPSIAAPLQSCRKVSAEVEISADISAAESYRADISAVEYSADAVRKSMEFRSLDIVDDVPSPVQLPSATHLRFAAQLREHESSLKNVTESADLKKLHLTNMRDLESCVSSMLRPRDSSPTHTRIVSPPRIRTDMIYNDGIFGDEPMVTVDEARKTFLAEAPSRTQLAEAPSRILLAEEPSRTLWSEPAEIPGWRNSSRIMPPARRSVEDSRDLLFNPRGSRTLSLSPTRIPESGRIRSSTTPPRSNPMTAYDGTAAQAPSADPWARTLAASPTGHLRRQAAASPTGHLQRDVAASPTGHLQREAAASPTGRLQKDATAVSFIDPGSRPTVAVSSIDPGSHPTAAVSSIDPGSRPTAAVSSIDPGSRPTAAISSIDPGSHPTVAVSSIDPGPTAAVTSDTATRYPAVISAIDSSRNATVVSPISHSRDATAVRAHATSVPGNVLAIDPARLDTSLVHGSAIHADECLVASPHGQSEANNVEGRRRLSDGDVPPQYCQLWDSPIRNSQIDQVPPVDRQQDGTSRQEPQLPRWLETWDVETSRIYSILRS